MTLLALTLNDAIFVQNDQVRTTSLKVAEAFGRQHKNVIQKIETLECSAEFASANFSAHVQKVSIGNGANRESKYYEMTKDGFMFLVMGFTGKVAAQIKEAYINAFNAMAAQLASQGAELPESTGRQLQRKLTPDERATLSNLIGAKAKECQRIAGGDWGKWVLHIEQDLCRICNLSSLNLVRYGKLTEVISALSTVHPAGAPNKAGGSSTDDRTGLRDAINLLVSKRGLMYPDAYSLIHHRFGVEHLDQMTKTQVTQAIEYVHCTLLDGEYLPKDSTRATLSQDDLRHLYGYFSSSMQLIDMYQQLKPMLDALNSLSLMGLRERIEMLRLCTTHFYDSHGPAILREAKRRGIAQEWLNFKALKDRSLPIILQ